mmetsp:Transcript_44879/g.97551  ORF Transcript_44879/g.97551 Transcript_44879/m.97551 type:complete len:146 (-) Transcript_44879:92-529(-)
MGIAAAGLPWPRGKMAEASNPGSRLVFGPITAQICSLHTGCPSGGAGLAVSRYRFATQVRQLARAGWECGSARHTREPGSECGAGGRALHSPPCTGSVARVKSPETLSPRVLSSGGGPRAALFSFVLWLFGFVCPSVVHMSVWTT